MKKIILFFCVFTLFTSFSQEITIQVIVKDFETNLPINEVTVTSLNTNQGFVTNQDGEAVVKLTKHSILEFSHSTYNTYLVQSKTLTNKINIIYLDGKIQLLEEVILTK